MRTVHLVLLLAGALALQATSASAQGAREPRYRDVTKLGGATSFYTKRPLTDAASLKAMADTRNMDRDIREVLVQGGVVPAAAARAVTADILSVMRGQLTPRRGGSCLTENPAEGELVECAFPAGGTLPFMAYRTGTTPHAMKNVRWAGDAPFEAFMFKAYSGGKTYAVVIPKSCGNLSLLPQPNASSLVTKLAKPERFAAGGQVSYTISVVNNAPANAQAARNVRLTDALPTTGGLEWTLGAPVDGCSLANGSLSCAWASLAPSDAKTVTVVSQASTPFAACVEQRNTARVSSDNAAPADDTAIATCVAPKLEVDKGPKSGAFTIGSAATFTITVRNAAAKDATPATAVVVTDTLPTAGGLQWQAATSTKGACDAIAGAALNCSIGSLAGGESATVTVTSRPAPIAACVAQANTAQAKATGGLVASDSATLSCTPPKLTVEKTPDNGTFTQGAQASFTVVVRNAAPAGASSATGVKLVDTLPTNGGLKWATADASAGTCTLSGKNNGSLACDLGTIAAGQAVTVTVKTPAKTPMDACQAQPNPAATATADGGLQAADAGSLSCNRSFWFFADAFGGKDRRTRPIAGVTRLDGKPVVSNAGAGLDFAQCSPLVGANIGIGKALKNHWELAATAGVALSVVQAGHKVREHEVQVDVEANKYLKNGMFVGTGVSMWDLFHSDSFQPALLTHFGVPLGQHPTHPIYFVGEGRLFFRQLDDVANNYQFWGGVRVHF